MKLKIIFSFLLLITVSLSFSQIKRFDSTVKIGKAGYRVTCSNKNMDKNYASIKPIGFESTAHDIDIQILGRIKGIEIDDFNGDGFPDIVIYVFSGTNNEMGNILAIASDENKSYKPIFFPDIRDDQKLREGYKGDDEFYLLNGMLMRSFPIYKTAAAVGKPTGGKRVIQYTCMQGENNSLKFKVVRSYEQK